LKGALGELADESATRYLVEHLPGRYIFSPLYDRSFACHEAAVFQQFPMNEEALNEKCGVGAESLLPHELCLSHSGGQQLMEQRSSIFAV